MFFLIQEENNTLDLGFYYIICKRKNCNLIEI